MSIDRISTASQGQLLLALINQAGNALDVSEQQVASGKVSTQYTGFGGKAALLEATRVAATKADNYQQNTGIAVNQADLQDSQMTLLSNITNQLRTTITKAVADNVGSSIPTDLQGIFDQVTQLLNTQDESGNYIYGGTNDNTPPVKVTTLAQLVALPTVADAFANSSSKKLVAVSDSHTVQVGVLASDAGTLLLHTIKDIATFDASASGNFAASSSLTQAQSTFLNSQISASASAANQVNSTAAANGVVLNQLKDSVTQQQSLNTLYKGFLSNIEDVDMPTALAQESQNQLALQAALQVTSKLGQLTLLNYLPANG